MTREAEVQYTSGVLTISDKGSRGEREDTSGEQLKKILRDNHYILEKYTIIPDNVEDIIAVLVEWVDMRKIDLILSTGGTGVAPSDVTPEATRAVIEKEIPGIAEAMRLASLEKTQNAVLSRAVAGIRGESLIINLPGSKKASQENLEAVLPALKHALYKIKGGMGDCG